MAHYAAFPANPPGHSPRRLTSKVCSLVHHKLLVCISLMCSLPGSGCAPDRQLTSRGQAPAAADGNTIFVPASNAEAVWERTVDVLHDYQFQIARENMVDGTIETEYKIGSGLLEPWHRESVGFASRLESTLQSIRRRVFVHLTQAQGGFFVRVEVFKELEDLAGLAANSAGGATFQESTPLQRDLNLVVGQSASSGWIAQGRDFQLEQELMRRLQSAYSRM